MRSLAGGAGNDTIDAAAVTTTGGSFWGGAGDDSITGTVAADTFYWAVGEGSDTITGGNPVTKPGDSLIFGGGAVELAFANAGPSFDGTLTAPDTSETVAFSSIEDFEIDTTGPATSLGYAGDVTLQNHHDVGVSMLVLDNGLILPFNVPTGTNVFGLYGTSGDNVFTIAGYDSGWTGGLSYDGLGGNDLVDSQVALGSSGSPWTSVSFTAETINLHDVYTTGSQAYTGSTITLASILSSTGSFIQVGGDLILQSSSEISGDGLTFSNVFTDGNGAWDVLLSSTAGVTVGQVGTAGSPLGVVRLFSDTGDLLASPVYADEAIFVAYGGSVGTSGSPVQTFVSRLSGYGDDGFYVTNNGGDLNIVGPGISSTDGDVWLENSGSIWVLDGPIGGWFGTVTVNALGESSDIVTGGNLSPAIDGWNVFLTAGRDVIAGFSGFGDIVAGESLFLTAGRDFIVDGFTWIEVAQANFASLPTFSGQGPSSCAFPPAPGSEFIVGRDIILDGQLAGGSHILSNGGSLLFQAGRNFVADWGQSGGFIRSYGGDITVEAGNGAWLYGPMYSCGGDIFVQTFAAPIFVGDLLDTTVSFIDDDGPSEDDGPQLASQQPYAMSSPPAMQQGKLTVVGQVFGYRGNTQLGPGDITLIAPLAPVPSTFEEVLWDVTNRTAEWAWASNYIQAVASDNAPETSNVGPQDRPLVEVLNMMNAWFAMNSSRQSNVYFYAWR